MAFTLNRRLSTLVDSSGQLKTGKIPNDYINGDHIADNVVTTAMLHTGFTLPISSLSSIDTDDVTEGSTNLFYTTARVDSHLSGGTGVTYSSGAISIGQAVATTDSPTFADLTITGNLNITGDINSYNVTDLDVTDQTITLGAGQIEANSGGSGIVIDGSNASILWDETNDQFDFNKGINVDSNTLVVDGTNNRVGILQASPAVSLDVGSATDAFFVPKGTTAQRPTGVDGYFRYNTDDAQFEGYADGAWGAIAGSGSGGSAMETDTFTGDGSTTAFTLSTAASSEDNLIVFIEGVYQNKDDYVVSGTTLTFDVAPVNTRKIVVHHVKDSISGNNMILNQFSGDGSTTAFTLTVSLTSENNSQVYIDGVYQQKDSYTVGGTTLTFDTAPVNGTTIEVMIFTQTTINVPTANSIGISELNVSDGTSGQVLTTNGSGTLSFSTISGYTDSDVETYLDGGTSTPTFSSATVTGDLIVDTDTLYVDSTNNRVGIGTSSPAVKLDLDNGSSDCSIRFGSDTGDWIFTNIRSVHALTLSDSDGTGEVLRVDTSGNVGIGTTNTTFATGGKLYLQLEDTYDTAIVASHQLAGATENPALEFFRPVGSNNDFYTYRIGMIGDDFRFERAAQANKGSHTSYSTTMHLDYNGNVGIGTNNPSGEFHVDSGLAPCDIHFTTGSTGGTGYDVNLNLTGGANNSEMNLNMGIAGNADREQIKTYQSTMRFITADTERMRIDSSGVVYFGPNGSTADPRINRFSNGYDYINSGDNRWLKIGASSGHTNVAFQDGSSGVTIFETAGAERMRIDSSGRVTTPQQPHILFSPRYSGGSGFANTHNENASYSRGTLSSTTVAGYARVTVPVAGLYLITFNTICDTGTGRQDTRIAINGSTITQGLNDTNTSGFHYRSHSITVDLAANDYLTFYNDDWYDAGNNNYSDWRNVSITLIG